MAEQMVFDADQVTAEVAEGIEKIQNASNLEELKAIKTTYAGADSAMTKASKAIGSLPADQKKEAGKLMGKLRADFGRAYGPKEVELKEAAEKAALAAETVDMTLPVSRKPLGARHPLPKLMEDVEDFFISMGWQISSGPEIEAEWYNFDSLNFGPDHPARQMQDTFYVKGNQAKDAAGFVGSNMVVRTQTSSDQVRALLTRGVPLYIASPGRVFRTDELDATHTPVFHQCEALAADAHVPADVKEQVIHGQIGIDPPLLRALIGKGRGHAEEIPGLHLRDVAGEGDPQQIVGPSPDGLALGHGLLALVIVPQPLSVGTDPVQKVRHRPGQSFLRQRPGANVVLFQIRKPPRSQNPAGMFRRAPVSPRSGGSLGPALYDFLR